MYRKIGVGAFACAALLVLFGASAQTSGPNGVRPARPFATTILHQRAMNFSAASRARFLAARARPSALAFRNALGRGRRFDFAAMDRSHVPVLLHARPELMADWRIYAAADRYTASAHKTGTVYEINGTRLPVAAPAGMRQRFAGRRLRAFAATGAPLPPANDDALENVRVDHTASGIDVTFTRFGHVYNVSVDCGGPAEVETETAAAAGQRARPFGRTANTDCTDAGALAFAQQMEVVGGGAQ
jgi:hypothetical protein